MNSSAFKLFKEANENLENFNTINMTATSVITVFGLIFNILALIVLIYSRNKLPHIASLNNLIIITVTNTAYLGLHFYIRTYKRIIFHFQIEYSDSLQLIDSNLALCKMLPYFRNVTLLLNATLIGSFSLERIVVVFRPLLMLSLTKKRSKLYKIAIAISFLLPCNSLFSNEIVQNTDGSNWAYTQFNLTRIFNLRSLTPSLTDFICSANKNDSKFILVYQTLILLVAFLSYIFISTSILAIVIKLKLKKRVKTIIRFKQATDTAKETDNENLHPLDIELDDAKNFGNQDIHNSSFLLSRNRPDQMMNTINHRTHFLSVISLSFALLNTPYFTIMIYLLINRLFVENKDWELLPNLTWRINTVSYIALSEVFQLLNFSITGFLFFCTGHVFRFHALQCLKKLAFFRK